MADQIAARRRARIPNRPEAGTIVLRTPVSRPEVGPGQATTVTVGPTHRTYVAMPRT
jgi:hypothetical protein